MRWAYLLLLVAALSVLALPASGAVTITANATPRVAHTGDVVTIGGTVNGTPTIAVFLFVMGPGLDPRGVTLDNLNIPTGRGLFTTAPVHLADGCWTYTWDTSVILGTLNPGKYTVYVLNAPVDRQRFNSEEYATTEIEFLPSESPTKEEPIDPVLPVLALAVAGCVMIMAGLKRE
jgi:hypothetical protein